MKPFQTRSASTIFTVGRGPVAAALMMVGLSLTPTTVLAADRFAVISIANETNANINVVYRWADDDAKKTHHFAPGARHWFSFKYAHANDNRSPDFFIAYDADTTGQKYQEEKRLHGFRAPEQNFDLGHQYVFKYDGPSKRFIEIYDRSKH